jgi:hypothetical protein
LRLHCSRLLLGCYLTEHHGVIDLGDGEVEVAISFHDSRLRLTSAGEEIGDWERSGYQLSRADPTTFVLSAEGADLTFRPTSPDEFAIAATHGMAAIQDPGSRRRLRTMSAPDGPEQAPPPSLLTVVLFYLLAAGTVGMAAWALISILG